MNKITIRQLTASTLLWLAAPSSSLRHERRASAGHAQQARVDRRPEHFRAASAAHAASLLAALGAGGVHHRQPARISLDLANTALALPSRRIDVRSGGVDSVLAAEAAGRTRLVLNLDRLLPYQTRVSGNDVIVLIGGAQQLSRCRCRRFQRSFRLACRSFLSAAPSGPRAIRGIDFRRGAAGTGRVIVRLSDPHTPASLRQLGNQIVVDFAGAEVASNLARRYDAVTSQRR